MNSFEEIWEHVCAYCREKLSQTAYDAWIKRLEPVAFEDGVAVLLSPNDFHRSLIYENYKGLIDSGFEQIMGVPIEFEIVIRDEMDKPEEAVAINKPTGNYEYTFDSFIVGPSNKFAHAASQAVANKPGFAYNPLFIYGDSGLGKTHLLYAIRNHIKQNNPNMNIIYTKGDEFSSELIEAIRSGDTIDFKRKYRSADVLLVDDINYIAGKNSTQEEFFNTFNTLFQDKKQIVLTSDRAPKDIATLEVHLRTRFEWGLLADIQSPDLETRIAIIKRKAELYELDISEDVCTFIAQKIKNNVRQLEGVVRKMNAYYLLNGEKPNLSSAQNAIRDIFFDNEPTPVTVDNIISEVARTFEVNPEDIRSNKRTSQVSVARQTAIYVVREITAMSLATIGEEFGGRDHSTIVYALGQAEKNMKKNPSYNATVTDIIKNIKDK